MKKIFGIALALVTTSVFAQSGFYQNNRAQNQEAADGTGLDLADRGNRHMIEFSPETLSSLVLSFNRTKIEGSDADSNADLNFRVNYAYGIHKFIQVGLRTGYESGLSGASNTEGMDLQVGGIVNSNTDFSKSAYASLFLGAGYIQDYGQGTRDDLRLTTVAVGKRISLTPFGVKHVVYSPEIALQMTNSTTDEALDYSQALQFRFLQFSVFF